MLEAEESFAIRVLQLYSLVDRFQLRGSQRGFSPSSLVSSTITRLGIILYLHLSSFTLVLHIYYLLFMFVHYESSKNMLKHKSYLDPKIKNYGSIDFTLTYTKCGIE